jgi:hypothetical protein
MLHIGVMQQNGSRATVRDMENARRQLPLQQRPLAIERTTCALHDQASDSDHAIRPGLEKAGDLQWCSAPAFD